MLFVFACVCSSIYANTRGGDNPELQAIDEQLSLLEKQLEILRKKSLNAEIQSQPYMMDNWEEFAEGIETAEENEQKIIAIKKKIQELEKQKKSFLDLNGDD